MNYLLDTNVIIGAMDGRLHLDFDDAETFSVSIMTRIELLGWHALVPTTEDRIVLLLDRIQVVPLTPPIADEAIALRRAHRLKTPDAIIAATAKLLARTLLTNDHKLLAIGDVPARPLV